jgi:hypothetical protein
MAGPHDGARDGAEGTWRQADDEHLEVHDESDALPGLETYGPEADRVEEVDDEEADGRAADRQSRVEEPDSR